jgi:hypothetical protein
VSEQNNEKPRWWPTPEEQRILAFTFIGGPASILVGVGIIGDALALGQLERKNGYSPGELLLITAFWLAAVLWRVAAARRRPTVINRFLALATSLFLCLTLLVLLGVAAGVK